MSRVSISTQGIAPMRSVGMHTSVGCASGNTLSLDAHDDCLSNSFNPLPSEVITPVNVEVLEFFLLQHPDRRLMAYVINGFRFGFDIGFRGQACATTLGQIIYYRLGLIQ